MWAPWLSLQPCLEMSVTLVRSACPAIQRRQLGTVPLGVSPRLKDFPAEVLAARFNQKTHRLLEVGSARWWDGAEVEPVLRIAHRPLRKKSIGEGLLKHFNHAENLPCGVYVKDQSHRALSGQKRVTGVGPCPKVFRALKLIGEAQY